MFFVEDDEADILQRREQGGTCANNNADKSLTRTPPGVITFAFTQAAVDDGGLTGETGCNSANGLRGEGDFRHEEDRAASLRDSQFDGAEVNLGFAAARDPMQQK